MIRIFAKAVVYVVNSFVITVFSFFLLFDYFFSAGKYFDLFLTHVEMVFLCKPYFSATLLFDRPFSRSLKVWYFSPKLFTLSFCLTEDMLLPEQCWKKRKNKLPNKVATMQVSTFECLKWTVWSTRIFKTADGKQPKNDWRDRENCST